MSYHRILATTVALAASAGLTAPAPAAPQPVVAPIMQKDLADPPGKEMLMLSVEYPPGAVETIHRPDAYAFIYVLEGTIIEQVRGGKEVTLAPGGRPSTKAPTMCTSSGATRAPRSRQSSSWSW